MPYFSLQIFDIFTAKVQNINYGKKKNPLSLNVTTFHSICLFAKGLSDILDSTRDVFEISD